MNEVVTINTENYATMAKAMGLPMSIIRIEED